MFNQSVFTRSTLAMAIAVPAFAEQPPAEEVVTVASHQPIAVKQSGSAITVITEEQLAARKSVLVMDVLRDVPGLAVSTSGVRGSQTDIRVRGAESNQVLVLFDGIEVNDAAQGDAFNWAHLTAADVARIEVVRGPQSALWGSEALAGVISITSKRAERGKMQTTLFSEAGSFGSVYAGASLASGGDRYHVRLSADRYSSDGDNISRLGAEKDGYRSHNLHLNSGYQLTDAVELAFVARRTDVSNEFDDADFGAPVDADKETETRQTFFRLQADVELLDGALQQRYAVSQSKHNNDNFDAGIIGNRNEARKRQYQWLNSLNWGDNNQRLSLLLERENQDFSARGEVLPWGNPNQDRTLHTNSAALEYRTAPIDALTLAGSVRYDDNSDFDSATTYRIDSSYRLNDGDTRLRATWGTAVKNPTLSERFGTFTNFIGNPDLQPESVKSWEVGVDQRLFGVDVGITYFNARLEDEINGFVFVPAASGFTAQNTIGVSRRKGAELTFETALDADISLRGSYTYTDATQPDGDSVRDEVRRPRHLASLNLDWRAGERLSLLLNAQYNGSNPDQDFSTFPATDVMLGSYTLVNVTANYDIAPSLQLYARLENLLDEQYEEVFGFQTLDRGGYVGVRFNFGG